MKYLLAIVTTTTIGIASWIVYQNYLVENQEENTMPALPLNSEEEASEEEKEQGIEFEYEDEDEESD